MTRLLSLVCALAVASLALLSRCEASDHVYPLDKWYNPYYHLNHDKGYKIPDLGVLGDANYPHYKGYANYVRIYPEPHGWDKHPAGHHSWDKYSAGLHGWDKYPVGPHGWDKFPAGPHGWDKYPIGTFGWDKYPIGSHGWDKFPAEPYGWDKYHVGPHSWDKYPSESHGYAW
ncbi:uncharacterized protein LOC126101473 [Schistocerca cancellata]|uniref:uncharacterized protein LOC126101473 n=1 Tax=Schistocerca cancellata TaxID=274614 RepID=UPI002118B718|nr:uncharacterized protein LOC126101473 [Schistocerca cancellata]